MTLAELIARFRLQARDDTQPYLWSDDAVTAWLNDAQEQAAIRGRLIHEDANPSVCDIELTPGQHTYPLHHALYEIRTARILRAGQRPRGMRLVSPEHLDNTRPDWRDDPNPSCFLIQHDTTIRVVGRIEAGERLVMEVYRLPLVSLRHPNDKPEIHRAHHDHLIQWALHEAFGVPDAESFDARRSEQAEQAFTDYFGLMPDADMRRITREDDPHHNDSYI